jgi:nicotinate-nucleotide adenylyltransferase
MERHDDAVHWVIFGGAFDPPHRGHIEKAVALAEKMPEANILFMPTYKNNWNKPLSSFDHRRAMLWATLRDFDGLIPIQTACQLFISSYEEMHKIEGPTIEVVKQLKIGFPGKLSYLIGHDQADLMDKWSEWEKLIQLVPFIVMSRKGYEENRLNWYRKEPHCFLDIPTQHDEISSTQIRERIRKNNYCSVEEVTPSTLDYIRRHALYV